MRGSLRLDHSVLRCDAPGLEPLLQGAHGVRLVTTSRDRYIDSDRVSRPAHGGGLLALVVSRPVEGPEAVGGGEGGGVSLGVCVHGRGSEDVV